MNYYIIELRVNHWGEQYPHMSDFKKYDDINKAVATATKRTTESGIPNFVADYVTLTKTFKAVGKSDYLPWAKIELINNNNPYEGLYEDYEQY